MANWKFAWLLKSYYVEYLSKIPRKEWIEMFKNEVRPEEDVYPWNKSREELPCHGDKISIKSRDGEEIGAVLYRPKAAEGKVPVYFQIHGGCFYAGCAEVDDDLCMRLVSLTGCCVISINYRLSPEYPYPAALNDCCDVISYFAEHAEEYQIDMERAGIGGMDVGGALAAAVCFLGDTENSKTKFRCLMLNCPSLDHSIENVPGDAPVVVENYVMADQCYCNAEEGKNPLVSPVYAEKEQLSLLPPTVLVTAEKDHEAESAENWAVNLQRWNVEVTAKRFLNMEHWFTMNCPGCWGGETAENAVVFLADGLKKYLK